MNKDKDNDYKTVVKAIVNVATVCFLILMLVLTVKICFWLFTGRW